MANFKPGIKEGDILKGHYRILQNIGEGGMSYVYLATDLDLMNKQWAVKEVMRSGTDPAGRPIEATLEREAEILSKLDHPSIVSIHDVFKTDDYIYVVMDHVEGQSLAKVLREEGAQSEEDVKSWMLQLCDALGYLHKQNPSIIYRDVKPGNIMLRPDGYIKLIDFGVVREYKDEQSSDTIAFGTEGFAAPEAYGSGQTDARSDIYSVGATMWNLLTGQAPRSGFPLPSIREYRSNVAEGFADVIIPKCTQIDRSQRYQTCEELAANLEDYEVLTKEYRGRQWKKVKAFLGTAIAAIAFLVIGIGTSIGQNVMVNGQFNNLVAQAQAQSSQDAAEEKYLQAIDKKPSAEGKEAYEGLMRLYKEDGTFSAEERETLTRLYEENLSGTSANSASAAELFFNIGELYWAYSDGDDSELSRIKNAESFFKKASDYTGADFRLAEEAKAYYSLVDYAKNVQNLGIEANSSVDFAQEWQYFSDLVTSGNLQPVVQLNNYKLIASQIVNYGTNFKEAGVTSAQASELLSTMDKNMAQFDSGVKNSKLYSDTASAIATARSYVSSRWAMNEGTVQ